jgi:hypothetical protein
MKVLDNYNKFTIIIYYYNNVYYNKLYNKPGE